MHAFEGTLEEALIEAERWADSGDLLRAIALLRLLVERAPDRADAWAALGQILGRAGDPRSGIDALQRSVALDPNHGPAFCHLGNLYMVLTENEKALAAYERYRELVGTNASLEFFSETLRGGCPPRPPPAVLQRIYDRWSAGYDNGRTEKVHPAPKLVVGAWLSVAGEEEAPTRTIMDLGCGTGACGPLLRPAARVLLGLDLSADMIEFARGRGVYDDLGVADAVEFFELGQPKELFDAVVASMLIYHLGDPTEVFRGVARALKPRGHFAFDFIESADDDLKMVIPQTVSYAHSRASLVRIGSAVGLREARFEHAAFRYESSHRAPMPGSVIVFEKVAEQNSAR